MAIKPIEELKSFFEAGDEPTEEQFIDLIDTIFDAIKYNSQLPDTQPVPVGIGGIPAGTLASVLKTKTKTQILDELLFPTVFASMTTPRGVSLNALASGVIEIGTVVSGALAATYNKGEITDGDGITTSEIGGDPINYEFTHLDGTVTDNSNVDTLNVDEEITPGVLSFQVKVTHHAGTKAYKDSKGNSYVDAALDVLIAQTIDQMSSPLIYGRYWVLIGTFDDAATVIFTNDGTNDCLDIALFNEKSLQNDGYEKSISYVGSRRKCVVAYPESYGNIEKFDFFALGTGVDKIASLVEHADMYRKLPNGSYVPYKCYSYTTLAAGNDSDTITLKV